MKGISCCADCANYKRRKCVIAKDPGTPDDSFYLDCPLPDVRPIKRGEWYGSGDGYADGYLVLDMWECTACGYVADGDEKPDFNFCPHCGADMREKA